ncbi:NADH-quinone oxidoreductase subunit L [Sphingobacteriales bacterium CHB3]|nr:NADH-quinone oxidoreductase subunit L [Sphingobacteriales bacterium CHB3]
MTLEDLNEVAEKELARQQALKNRVLYCSAAGCVSCGSEATRDAFKASLKEKGLEKEIEVIGSGCMGLCGEGPLVKIASDDTLYQNVDEDAAQKIVRQHLLDGKKVENNALDPANPFFSSQLKIVLENCGRINAERIEEYIAVDGYEALAKALTEMKPDEVIDEIRKSGLRGRGGAGYPTGLKWGIVRKAASDQKYVICNADEGDPGAFMDRSVLEGDPHRILEGMAIAAYAVGANQGYIYIRAEYPLAIERLRLAIKQAERLGLLGNRIFESQFNFRIDLRIGAGAFVCGEETALIRSIEGRRGRPKPRPPYPSEKGLFGAPTLLNNVETYANVAPIINRGSAWFAAIGTPKSTGTKVFALAGKIKNTGLIEVPMGIPLRTVIFDIGGGTPEGTEFKAAQTGGPSGGCIPNDHLDLPVDYESLATVGSIMGSGGMIVMDSESKMVDVAKYFMEFCADESCGKCVPCRVGTKHIYLLLDKISKGNATADDVALLEELCEMVKDTSLCGLGQSAPNPVLSTLRFFRHEYEELLKPVETYIPSDVHE